MKRSLCAPVCFILLLNATPINADITISAAELHEKDILASEPLLGFRYFPTHLIIGPYKNDAALLPIEFLRESTKKIPQIEAAIKSKFGDNFRHLSTGEFLYATKSWAAGNQAELKDIGYYAAWKNNPGKILHAPIGNPAASLAEIPNLKGIKIKSIDQMIMVKETGDLGVLDRAVDPYFVTGLLHTELFDLDQDLHALDVNKRLIEAVSLRSEVALSFRRAYEELNAESITKGNTTGEALKNAVQALKKYPQLYAISAKLFADVTFGRPIIYSAKDKLLNIPPSISDRLSVYWVEFAFSYTAFDVEDLHSIEYKVKFPDRVVALELVPLVYGTKATVSSELKTPDISVEVPGRGKVAVGKVFEQTVSYESIKPEILGFGLQESTFSWRLTGEAVRPGARRFVAILGIPHGTVQLDYEMSAIARLSGRFAVQADQVATNSVARTATLPRLQ